jgi:hypothetical protein
LYISTPARGFNVRRRDFTEGGPLRISDREQGIDMKDSVEAMVAQIRATYNALFPSGWGVVVLTCHDEKTGVKHTLEVSRADFKTS